MTIVAYFDFVLPVQQGKYEMRIVLKSFEILLHVEMLVLINHERCGVLYDDDDEVVFLLSLLICNVQRGWILSKYDENINVFLVLLLKN